MEGRSNDGHRIVSPLNNQHANELFVAVDDKVATTFIAFFFMVYEQLRREAFEMTSIALRREDQLNAEVSTIGRIGFHGSGAEGST